MSILVGQDTKVVVQGITGQAGGFHAKQMLEYGTRVVAGVVPGKGGQKFEGVVPLFNTVDEAVRATGCNASVIFVPENLEQAIAPKNRERPRCGPRCG